MRTTAASVIAIGLLIGVAVCQRPSSDTAGEAVAPAAVVSDKSFDLLEGTWKGDAKIIVDWVQNTQLAITLTIDAEGNVTGKVGDAELIEARVHLRSIDMNRDFRVHGQLEGDLVAAEGVQRGEVDILFDHPDADTLVGGLHSSGSKFGGKDSMKVSAMNMTLKRAASSAAATTAADKQPPTRP